jgi:hypothetical protein
MRGRLGRKGRGMVGFGAWEAVGEGRLGCRRGTDGE